MIAGKPLSEFRFSIRNKTKALEMAEDALAQGHLIPEKALALMGKLGITRSLYVFIGNKGWKSQAKENIPIKTMCAQPFKMGFQQAGGE